MPQQQYVTDFVNRYTPYAVLASQQTGIPARVILAEAAAESQWGRSGLSTQGNSLFGIKAYDAASRATALNMRTGEDPGDGSRYYVNSPFQTFSSPEQSFQGFVDFLKRNPRQAVNLSAGASGLATYDAGAENKALSNFAKSGYATNTNVDSLLGQILKYNIPQDLTKWTPATSFDPKVNQAQNAIGYQSDGSFNTPLKLDTNANGVVPDSLGSFGVNGITANAVPSTSVLDRLSDQFTAGLENAGNAVANTGKGFLEALGSYMTAPVPDVGPQPSEPLTSIQTPDPITGDFSGSPLNPVPTGNPIQTPDPITGSFSGGSPLSPVATSNPIATPDPLTGNFSGSPLSPVATGNPIATPDPITANFGSPLSPVSTGPNVSQGVGNGSFQGTFDPASYLAANPDVAAAHVDPLQHYLTSGYKEGRALDTQGDRINQGFNPSQYLQANPDVASAGMNPLQHYLQFGAHEGRSTSFAGNVSPGSFGTGITPNGPTEVSAQPPQSLADMITSAYQADLHRAPDAAAFQAAYDGISSGQDTFGQFQARMAASPEAQAFQGQGTNAPMLNTATPVSMQAPQSLAEMINATYQAQLQRSGEDGAVRDEADAISSGRDTFEAFQARMQASPEAQASRGQGVNAPMLNTATPVGTQGPTDSETTTAYNGHFDPNAYLAANADVKASGMDPLTHYLTYGFKEGRALDTQGDRINQAFDPSKYLAANPDVAQANMDPLKHYLLNGASEGRAAPTGSNPYSFSNFNVAQGAGATGSGGFGLGGITSTGGIGSTANNPTIPNMGGGFNVSGSVQNGAFGLGGITSGSSGSSGGGISNPYGFSGANVGGFNANGGGGSSGGSGGVEDFAAGTKDFNLTGDFEPTASEDFSSGKGDYSGEYGGGGFNPQASEMSYLRGQLADQYAQNARLASSGDAGKALAAIGATQNAQLDATGSANAARQFAGIQGGLGITPVTGTSFFTPAPVIRVPGLGGAPMFGFF